MKYIAIDPGETTGICWYGINAAGEDYWFQEQIGPQPHHAHLLDMLRSEKPDVVICERFTYQQRDKVVLTSVEYIGIVKLYHQLSATNLVFQMASQVGVSTAQKGFWTDAKIKALDLWIPGMTHAMDATRHMLYYLTQVKKDMRWIHRLRPEPSP